MKRTLISLLAIILTLFTTIPGTTSCTFKENVENTGETFDGTYMWSLGEGGSSTYTFEGNKVTNRYYTTHENVIEYTYVIAIEDGVKVIQLTDLSDNRVYEYEFREGNGYVVISGQRYDKVEE